MDIGDLYDIWNRSRITLTMAGFSPARDDENQYVVFRLPRIYETALAGFPARTATTPIAGRYTDLISTARDETDAADLVKQYLSDPERRIADTFKHKLRR